MDSKDDSLMLSLQELQEMEAERLRDEQRQRVEAERALELRREAERSRTETEAASRARALAAAAEAEGRAREEAAHQAAMARATRELSLRAEIEATTEARQRDRQREHEASMAALAAEHPRGMSAMLALVLAAAVIVAAVLGGYVLVVQPMARTQAVQLRLLQDRADRAEAAAQVARNQTAAAEHAVQSTPVVTAVTMSVTHPAVVLRQDAVHPRMPRRGTHPVAPATEGDPTVNLDNDPGNDPLGMDDLARPARRHH